jgi:hypothetical protein
MSTAAGSGDHIPATEQHHTGHDTGRSGDGTSAGGGETHKAGAFDIRVFIASLIGIYGVVLTIAGLIGPSDAELTKTGGVNINLWAGLGMLVVFALFITWARLRPVVVPAEVEHQDGPPVTH